MSRRMVINIIKSISNKIRIVRKRMRTWSSTRKTMTFST